MRGRRQATLTAIWINSASTTERSCRFECVCILDAETGLRESVGWCGAPVPNFAVIPPDAAWLSAGWAAENVGWLLHCGSRVGHDFDDPVASRALPSIHRSHILRRRRRAAGTSLTEISAPKAPPPPPPKRPRNQRVITVPVDGPATHDGSLGPQRASTRLHLCIPEPQRTNKQSGRVDIGVPLATNCLGDNLEESVCGFDERVQRQVERSFCLAASVSLSRAMLAVMPGIAGQCQMSVERGCVFQTPCILAVS